MNVKPEYTSSVCQIKSGMGIPATLLTKLIAENRSAIGLVVKEGDKLFVEKEIRLKSVEEVTAWMGSVQANTQKFSRMITFHSVQSGEYDEDEVQPYTFIRDSKGKPVLAVCIEGDFPTFANDDEGASEACCLARDWLGPKIEAMYALLGNNPSKTVEWLKTEQFMNDFKLVVGHRGVLAFMPVHGDQFMISAKNDLGLASDWGQVSNAYGYTEAAIAAASPAAAEKVPDKPASKASRYADPPAADPAAAPAAPAPQPPPIPKVDPAPVTDPVVKAINAETLVEEEVDFTPEANLHGKDLKLAYRKALGLSADEPLKPRGHEGEFNWKKRPTVRIKVQKTVKSLADLAQTKPGLAAAAAKDDSFPIMSGEKMAHANEFLKKVLGDGSAVISDPVNSNEIEKSMAKFSQLCLKTNNLEDCRRIPHAAIFAFAADRNNAEAVALWIIELRAIARKYWDLERMTAPAPITKPGEQVEVPAPALPAAPAAPAPAAEPAAKKGALKYA